MPPIDPRDVASKLVGQTINNKWTVDRLLDVGGMAAVYAATHRNGRKVAIKMLHAAIAIKDDARERFLREGYVANLVDHPGAVSILDDDLTPAGLPFIVMELLEGESLDHWMDRAQAPLLPTDVLAVADQVLDVLHAFHARSIVHRDIKPGNLFMTTQGVVKVLDFGLARLRDSRFTGAPTASGIVLGTASFMPPEQALGKVEDIDARSDVFALGAVMFRALSGRAIHDGKTPMERVFQAMRDRAPGLMYVAPDLPRSLGVVVDRALVFERDGRWASALDMQTAVREVLKDLDQKGLYQEGRLATLRSR